MYVCIFEVIEDPSIEYQNNFNKKKNKNKQKINKNNNRIAILLSALCIPEPHFVFLDK